MDGSESLAFRSMLVEISKSIGNDEFRHLKSLCKDFIGARQRSEMQSPIDLFEELENQGKLKKTDLIFLKKLLESGCKERPNLITIVETYERSHSSSISADQRSIALFLSQKLDKKYKMFLRHAGLDEANIDRLEDENPRNMQEVIYKGVSKCFSDPVNASIENVVEALEKASRTDLAQQVQRGSYK